MSPLLARQPPLLIARLDLPAEPGNIVITLGLIAILVSIAAACVSIWHMTKRQPPIEQYVDRELTKFETRVDSRFGQVTTELTHLRADSDRNARKLHERLERENKNRQDELAKVTKSIEAGMQDLHRAIGRIEGKLE